MDSRTVSQAAGEKLKDITSGTKYKMLLHTADYLNRLVKDFTEEIL
ncbi:hypothetical protein [Rheinheimera oceanensis]|nr:hypothetical protein [Rheinheimera oceanensis]